MNTTYVTTANRARVSETPKKNASHPTLTDVDDFGATDRSYPGDRILKELHRGVACKKTHKQVTALHVTECYRNSGQHAPISRLAHNANISSAYK